MRRIQRHMQVKIMLMGYLLVLDIFWWTHVFYVNKMLKLKNRGLYYSLLAKVMSSDE